jgi:hypothetical protein
MGTDGPSSLYVAHAGGLLGVLRQVEAVASIFVVVLLTMLMVMGGGIFVFRQEASRAFVPLLIAWVGAMSGEFLFIVWLKRSRDLDFHPFIPRFALRQICWPILLRPLVAAFWLAHFLLNALILIAFERILMPTGGIDWLILPVLILVIALLTHCSLMFLFLAITSVYRGEQLIDTLWRWRLVVDLTVTGALLVCAKTMLHGV